MFLRVLLYPINLRIIGHTNNLLPISISPRQFCSSFRKIMTITHFTMLLYVCISVIWKPLHSQNCVPVFYPLATPAAPCLVHPNFLKVQLVAEKKFHICSFTVRVQGYLRFMHLIKGSTFLSLSLYPYKRFKKVAIK